MSYTESKNAGCAYCIRNIFLYTHKIQQKEKTHLRYAKTMIIRKPTGTFTVFMNVFLSFFHEQRKFAE